MAEEDVIVRFQADIDQFKASLTELTSKVTTLDGKVESSQKKTKKGFDDVAKSAKNLGKDVVDGLGNKFTQLGSRIAAAFAISQVIAFGRESVKAFREAEQSANQLRFAITNISNEGVKAYQTLIKQAKEFQAISIFSDEQIQNSQNQLVQFGLTSVQVEKLIPQIIDLASAQNIDLAQATDKVIQGINGQTRGLKDAGIAFEDTGSKTENLAILSEKLAKFQGSTAVALNTSAGAAKNLENQINDLQEAIGEKLSPIISDITVELFDMIAGFVGAETQLDKFQKKFASSQGNIASFTDTYRKLTDAQLDAQERFVKLDILEEGKKRDQALTQEQKQESNKRIINIGDELKAIQALKEERKKASEDQQKIRNDLTVKGQNDLTQAKLKEKQIEEALNKEKTELIRKQGEVARDELEKQQKETQDLLRKQAEVAREKYEKSLKEDAKLLRKSFEFAREEYEKKQEEYEKKQEEDKILQEKVRLDRIDQEKEMLSVIGKAYDDAFQKRKELAEQEIDLQEKNIDTQRNLAERGLANTLDFEEKRAAELRRKQQVEAERNKRIKILETFLNALADFSKDDAKNALPKALLQVALATAASAAFAEEGGVIGEIKERSFSGRRHRGGGDVLVHAQTGEGILPRDSMNVIGRGNFELLRNVGRHPIREDIFKMPKLDVHSVGSQVSNEDVVREIKTLQTVIKNKKESHYSVDEFGNYIKRTMEDGIKTITKGKLKKPRWRG